MFDFETYLNDKNREAGSALANKIDDLVDAMKADREHIMNSAYPKDMASEYADSSTPVYNNQLLEMALDNLCLGHGPEQKEYLPEGTTDAYTIIKVAVYEQLHEVASTLIATWEQELDDAA